jgi:hypothetical protein
MLSAIDMLNNTMIADGKLIGMISKIESPGNGKVIITTVDNQVISADSLMVVSKDVYEPNKKEDGTYTFKSRQ